MIRVNGLSQLGSDRHGTNSLSARAYGRPDWPPTKNSIDAALQGALVYRHQFGNRIDGLPYGGWIVGGTHHERRRENPPVYKFLEHQRAERLAGLPGLVASKVSQVAVTPSHLEVRAQAGLGNDLLDAAPQLAADLVKSLGERFPLAAVDDGQHGR